MSLSTVEVEYIVAVACCSQVLWMRKTLKYVQVEYDHPISIFRDNTSAISISKNSVTHSKTKHIPIKYHCVREHVAKIIFKLEYVDMKEQIVDFFIKPLPRENFEYLRGKLEIVFSPK